MFENFVIIKIHERYPNLERVSLSTWVTKLATAESYILKRVFLTSALDEVVWLRHHDSCVSPTSNWDPNLSVTVRHHCCFNLFNMDMTCLVAPPRIIGDKSYSSIQFFTPFVCHLIECILVQCPGLIKRNEFNGNMSKPAIASLYSEIKFISIQKNQHFSRPSHVCQKWTCGSQI